jgi:DNA-binding response OmpR family regulator
MEILLVEREKLARDQIKVGLRQFPEFVVTTGEGYSGINEARTHEFDCIFLGVDGRDSEGMRVLQQLRTFDRFTDVVVVANAKHCKELQSEKSRWNIVSFLSKPIDATEFFRLVGRLRARRVESPNR